MFREPSNRTNGQTFDAKGRLYHCEGAEFGPGGGRRVTRTDLDTGNYEVLCEQYEGQRFNSPNDICVDGRGRVYFTDPRYGDRSDMEMDDRRASTASIRAAKWSRVIASSRTIERPNGIAVTQDCRGACT